MDNKDVKTLLMYGPQISDPTKLEEREVPVDDIQAYKALGWVEGAMPKDAKVEDVTVPAPAPPVMSPVVDPEAPKPEEKIAKAEAKPDAKAVKVVKGKK